MGQDAVWTGVNGCRMGSVGFQMHRTRRTNHCRPKTEYLLDGWPQKVHQQTVIRSGSYTQTSLTIWLPLPVLLSTSRCSQTPLELYKVLSDSARAFSCAFESSWGCGGTFRILQNLTIRIGDFIAAKTLVQVCRRLRDQLRSLHKLCGRLGAIFSHQWFLGFHNHKAFHRLYWSLLQSQDSLHPIMTCIV